MKGTREQWRCNGWWLVSLGSVDAANETESNNECEQCFHKNVKYA
jgi:hypothetical protein